MTRPGSSWRQPYPIVMQRVAAPIADAQRDELTPLFEAWWAAREGSAEEAAAYAALMDAAGRQVGA